MLSWSSRLGGKLVEMGSELSLGSLIGEQLSFRSLSCLRRDDVSRCV